MKIILLLVQLPPPVHGVSVVNESIIKSKSVKSSLTFHWLNISPADVISDIGRASMLKILKSAHILFSAVKCYWLIKPDLVYMTISPIGLALYKDSLIALALKLMGARLVYHLHGKGIATARGKSRFKNWFYKKVFANTDVIHLATALTADIAGLVPPNRIHIVNNGIKPMARNGTDHKSIPPVRFLYLSNLVREKGSLDLLNACAQLRDIESSFSVVMAGRFFDADFEREFRARNTELAPSNVTLLDHGAYGEDKAKLLSDSHVLVLPTYYPNECFPLTLLEAMSAHMAIISTDEGAISDMVTPGENGLLVEKQSPESIAKAMRYFIENPQEAQRMGENGYKRYCERYTFEIFEQRLVSVLQAIANRK